MNTSLWKDAALLEVIRYKDVVNRCQLFMIKANDWCICGLPAESFVDAGLAIKNERIGDVSQLFKLL